jgi:hypothetical protein
MNALFKEAPQPGVAGGTGASASPDRLAQRLAGDRQNFVPPRGRALLGNELADDVSSLPSGGGFKQRVEVSGRPAESIEDRRPQRPGTIPGQYGPVTPDDQAAYKAGQAAAQAAAPPAPQPPLGSQLSKAAGYDTVAARGAAAAFEEEARERRRLEGFTAESRENSRVDDLISMHHRPTPQPTLADMIEQVRQRRRRVR